MSAFSFPSCLNASPDGVRRSDERYFSSSDGFVFSLPAAYLQERVPLLESMFSLPQEPGNTEGSMAANTIALPMLTSDHVLAIETFLFRNKNLHLKGNIKRLLLLLHAADAWDCDEARVWVVRQLPRCPEWNDVTKLRLAQRYRQPIWFGEAFKELVWRKASDFTPEDREALGHGLLFALDTARDRVDTHRKLLACSDIPFTAGSPCARPAGQCKAVFTEAWADVRTHMLCSPTDALRGKDIIDKFDKLLTGLTEICGACQVLSLEDLRKRGQFVMEDVIIADCIDAHTH
ncbi:hypothetical protein PENSPDRAFT_692114 [Peniophora sp. CONT]|nr:hypothetical protein PENSPDRAFT_692114 [Peniophora sp. CONT]